MPRIVKSKLFSGLTIPKSSGTISSIATIIGSTDWPTTETQESHRANKVGIMEVWIIGASADFYYGSDSAHADKALQDVSVEPVWKREGSAYTVENVYLRAFADADITSVAVEIFYGG